MIAQYWRVRKKDACSDPYSLSVAEMRLIGSLGEELNPTATITASGTGNHTLALDGNAATYWSEMLYAADSSPTGREFVKFSFAAPVDVGSVYIDSHYNSPVRFLVEFSTDNNIWYVIARDTESITNAPRTITVPAAFPVISVGHPYWALRPWSTTIPATDATLTEIYAKDNTGNMLNAQWYLLSTAYRDRAVVTNVVDNSVATSVVLTNSRLGQQVAGMNLVNGTPTGTIRQSGLFWEGAATILDRIYLDSSQGTSKLKSFTLAFADALSTNPSTGYDELYNWYDVLTVDDATALWTQPLLISGLATGNPVIIPAPPTVAYDKTASTYAPNTAVAITASRASTIYYTVDGSTPTAASTVYSEAIIITETTTIKAIAVALDDGGVSNIASVLITIDTVAPVLTFSVNTGAYTAPLSLTLSTNETATIYYTLDGSTPTIASSVYSTALSITTSKTVTAIAKDAYGNISTPLAKVYTIGPQIAFTLPPGNVPQTTVYGTYTGTQPTAYYTTDGSTPTTGSPRFYFNSTAIAVSIGTGTKTVKVLAVDGYGNTTILTGDFTAVESFLYHRFRVIGSQGTSTTTPFKHMEFRESQGGPNVVIPENVTSVVGTTVASGAAISIDLFTTGSGYSSTVLKASQPTVTVTFNTPRRIRELLLDVSGIDNAGWPYTSYYEVSVDGINWITEVTLTPSASVHYSAYGTYGLYITPIQFSGEPDITLPLVVIDKAPGQWPPGTLITLSSTENGSKYYTTDGTEPSIASTVYTAPIVLNNTMTLKVMTRDSAGNNSLVTTGVYEVLRSYKFWRYVVTAAVGSSTYKVRNLAFYEVSEGANIVIPENSPIITGSVPTAGAALSIDAFTAGSGYLSSFSMPFQVTVEFPTAREVVDYKIDMQGEVNSNNFPYSWTIQASIDGIAWMTVRTRSSNPSSDFQRFGYYGLYYDRAMPVVGDTIPPVVSCDSEPGAYMPATQLRLITSKRARMAYTINNDPPTIGGSYTQPITYTNDFTLKAIAQDLAGNLSTIYAGSFQLIPAYRYWRFSFQTNYIGNSSNIAVKKLELRSTMGGPNIVTVENGATVTCSAITGVTINNFITASPTVINSTGQAIVQVTFPTAMEVREFLVDVFGCTANYRPKFFYIQNSLDGTNWTTDIGVDLVNAVDYITSYRYLGAAKYGTQIVTPVLPGGKYAANTVLKFDQNMWGSGSLIYTKDGQIPDINNTNGTRLNGAVALPTAGLTFSGGTKTLKVIGYSSVRTPWNKSAVATATYEMDTIASAVQFSIPSGEYVAGTTVELTIPETGTIYYTVDGTVPTISSTVYSAPININSSMLIRAISKDTFNNTTATFTEAAYSIPGSAPLVIFDKMAGEYLTNSTVALTATKPATIYYTLDGTTPTEASAVYTVPLVLDIAKTITAIAKATEDGVLSAVAAKAYTVDFVVAHKFWRYRIHSTWAIPSGTYVKVYGLEFHETIGGANVATAGNIVSLYNSPANNNAVLASTGTGSTAIQLIFAQNPCHVTVEFIQPRKIKELKIRQDTGLSSEWPRSFACEFSDDGINWTSSVVYRNYTNAEWPSNTISVPFLLTAPTPTIAWSSTPGVCLSGAVAPITPNGVKIVTTADGSIPDIDDATGAAVGTGSLRVTPSWWIYATGTYKVVAYNIYGGKSDVLTGTFTVDQTAPTLTFSLVNGATYDKGTTFSITSNEPGTIYYTVNNTTPTAASPQFTVPVAFNSNITVRFYGVDTVGNATGIYVRTLYVDMAAPSVTISPAAGVYEKNQLITLSIAEPGTIRYTTDGSTPDSNSTLYTGPVPLSTDFTIKAIAWDNSANTSPVVSRAYTIERVLPVVTFATLPGTYSANLLKIYVNVSETSSIFYTLDGSTPTAASAVYDVAIPLAETATVKVIAIDMSDNVSSVLSGYFTVQPATKILFPRVTDINSAVVTPGDIMIPENENRLYSVDTQSTKETVTEVHIGSHQPLANVRIWQDTASGMAKYNNGVEWVATKSPTVPKDFGEF